MSPNEMQAIIDGLRGDAYNLYMMASEPHQTPVHPSEPISPGDRSERSRERASDDEVDEVIQSVIEDIDN